MRIAAVGAALCATLDGETRCTAGEFALRFCDRAVPGHAVACYVFYQRFFARRRNYLAWWLVLGAMEVLGPLQQLLSKSNGHTRDPRRRRRGGGAGGDALVDRARIEEIGGVDGRDRRLLHPRHAPAFALIRLALKIPARG